MSNESILQKRCSTCIFAGILMLDVRIFTILLKVLIPYRAGKSMTLPLTNTAVTAKLICVFFRICKKPFFSRRGLYNTHNGLDYAVPLQYNCELLCRCVHDAPNPL